MMRKLPIFATAAALLVVACSDDTTSTVSATSCDDFGEVGEAGQCDALCTVSNEAFCAGVAGSIDCGDLAPGVKVDMCGVPLKSPPKEDGILKELERSSQVQEYGGTGPVDLSCYSPAGYPPAPGMSATATVTGVAKIFSHGCESRDLKIEIFTVVRDGSADDGKPDQLIGTAVTTPADCSIDGVAEENEDCGTRYECVYSYPDVPTDTELLIRTDGDIWAPIYEYGLYVPNGEVVDGEYVKDVRALAQDDYGVIAQVAMGKNISPGNGAVAGEVRDCGDVRLLNAIVDIDRPKFITTYFTDDEENPLPDVAAIATSTLGLYAAMDVAPGPVTIAGAGLYDGQLVGVGHYQARVFADAVTSVTFRGLRGFQVPQ